MKRQPAIDQTAFDSLLSWLAPDREEAGAKYEQIRQRLIKIFTCRGRGDADELADETINRVTLKVERIAREYVGDPALYFYGVAQKVYLESLRRPPPAVIPALPAPTPDEVEPELDCLEKCMEQLAPGNRELILEYYQNDRGQKVECRKRLAERLKIAQNAVRIRAHRIRLALQRCVEQCLAQNSRA